MSTDDSLSEDVSSSGGLSHCHADANGGGGKGSEASLASSEGTSASGLAGHDDACTRTSQTTGGTVETVTPACIPHKIRSLCLSTEEAFGQGRSLPFINPSSLETLRALVKEIQSSGETDPEMWKDCEGRWLHLFQLVEKQYQEQILAQQEQYQCQIQLIQDEIKALVQLQNRQCSGPPHTDSPPPPVNANNKTNLPTSISTPPPLPPDLPYGTRLLSAPAPPPLTSTSPSPPPQRSSALNPGESADERAATVLSSGYGTLSAWEAGLEQTVSPTGGVEEEAGQGSEDHRWSPTPQEDTETLIGCEPSSANEMTARGQSAFPRSFPNQHTTSKISSQPLTSWAQRHKLRPRKSAAGPDQASSPQPPEPEEPPASPRDTDQPLEHMNLQDQHRSAALPSTSSFPLRRSDSLLSEASGLTYWRLDESELYRPLPDSFDSGAYFRLQEASMSMTEEEEEPRPSLREIYQNKQRAESRRADWDGSLSPSPVSPQALTLDPAAYTRQSDRTSGFTSPSHFSSPSFPPQPPPLAPGLGPPASPDSMAGGSVNPGDTDCTSNTSSLSCAAPTPATEHHPRALPDLGSPFPSRTKAQSQPLQDGQPRRARVPLASEEDGSHTHTSTLRPTSCSHAQETRTTPSGASRSRTGVMERAASLDDPVVVSLLRQNLREKHSRHIADLKAYYESEIRTLRDQLSLRDLPQDLEKSNQALRERCNHLDRALIEASSRIQELETNNLILERKLADWPERYAVAGATVTALQQRLEESKRCGGEKEALAAGLSARVRQLEEAAQTASREAQEQEARREREYKMLQDLLGEYDCLRKDHEGVKNNLVSTENSLLEANEQISELKRVISKLESQVKQLEHESQARSRYAPHGHTQPSGAGLYHHPDLLLSPRQHPRKADNTYRRSPCPHPDQSDDGRKNSSPQTDQSNGYRKSPCLPTDQPAASSDPVNSRSRCSSPPVRDQVQEAWPGPVPEPAGGLREPGRREGPLTPVMRALIELEETRTTESRAPWLASRRSTVGFIDMEPVQERGRPIVDRAGAGLSRGGAEPQSHGSGPRGGATPQSHGYGAGGGAALLRARRSLSPEGPRSSSLPPPGLRTFPPATPTKRETMLAPLSAKSSPKRSPIENYSTAFGQPLPRQQYLHKRFDVPSDQSRHSPNSASPRKRLHFTALDRTEAPQQAGSGVAGSSGSVAPSERGSRLGWEEPGLGAPGEDSTPSLQTRLHSLADAERLFDELTQEKQQIEAALSRMPGAGSRVSLQTRLDEVALEKRLERVNQDLGSIRMTLKRFHILRSSANI